MFNGVVFSEDILEMVLVWDIDFFSFCEYYIFFIIGCVYVVYIFNGKVIGLLKIVWICEMYVWCL